MEIPLTLTCESRTVLGPGSLQHISLFMSYLLPVIFRIWVPEFYKVYNSGTVWAFPPPLFLSQTDQPFFISRGIPHTHLHLSGTH